MINISWQNCQHNELTTQQLYQILKLRNEVFIVEQQCVYLDVDGQDLVGDNRHIMAWSEDELIAYARILSNQKPISIGRVIIAPNKRGERLGEQLMTQALKVCDQYWSTEDIILSAQAHLINFYGSFGFIAISEVYDEDGIPHIKMLRTK